MKQSAEWEEIVKAVELARSFLYERLSVEVAEEPKKWPEPLTAPAQKFKEAIALLAETFHADEDEIEEALAAVRRVRPERRMELFAELLTEREREEEESVALVFEPNPFGFGKRAVYVKTKGGEDE